MQVLNDPVTVNREQDPVRPLVIYLLRRLGLVLICKSGNLLNPLMKASEESTSFTLIYPTVEYIGFLVPVFRVKAGIYFYVIRNSVGISYYIKVLPGRIRSYKLYTLRQLGLFK